MATPQKTTSLERLQEELAQKSEEVSVLRQMSSEVNATLNLDEIYEAVLGTMYDLFGFHHSLILLLDDSGETLSVVASRGYEDPAVGAKAPVGVGVIGTVARRRKMMRVGTSARRAPTPPRSAARWHTLNRPMSWGPFRNCRDFPMPKVRLRSH